ncbi:hypothetical protein NADFUDRAFT_51266 [Nadsonia fulvescens var. elongata DSM 6958]|uniref:RING-type domain-containing protein n=1 Tax=Nadsonia fulvescens var. elongata DSM 6958 TaxID=857566 RepID=A0A1E3PKN0_9ASCO|nr:hypothetical protein NADFUDRAFT_51266 [Nadsonia fulvescens var. elongata DSM 6958]
MANGAFIVASRRATRIWGLVGGGFLVMMLALALLLNRNQLGADMITSGDLNSVTAYANDDNLANPSGVRVSRPAKTSFSSIEQLDIPVVISPYDAVITSPEADWTIYARPAAFGSFNFGHQDGSPGGDKNSHKDPEDETDSGDPEKGDGDDNSDHNGNEPNKGEGSDDPDDGAEYPDGLTGKIVTVKTSGCFDDNDLGNRVDLSDSIALVLRGNCGFYEKVLNLQSWGAVAVIVGDNIYGRGLVTMYKSDDSHSIKIPSVFVTRSSYEDLRLVNIVHISLENSAPSFFDTLLFGFISPLFSITIIYLLFMFNRYYKGTLERAPVSYVNKLPTRLWMGVPECTSGNSSTLSIPRMSQESSSEGNENEATALLLPKVTSESARINNSSNHDANSPLLKSYNSLDQFPPHISMNPEPFKPQRIHHHEKVWVSSAECIICLEEYVIGESMVMRLPCGHDFHVDCIKQWLINEKRTCPICKQDIMTKDVKNPLDTDNSDETSQGSTSLLSRLRNGWRRILREPNANDVEEASELPVPTTNNSRNSNISENNSGDALFLV